MLLTSLLCALAPVSVDTVKSLDIEEAVVVASPKETAKLRRQPLSVSLFNAEDLARRQVDDVKGLSMLSSSLYIPDYGSRLTSAIYVRGVGSRMNTPAVGLYVDNVPYADKTAYDFGFQGIDRVDVLRGPQGTLYGRNAMGGLIRIFTADPLTHHGTELSAGIEARSEEEESVGGRAAFTTFFHPAQDMGLSLSGYVRGSEGFFRNQHTGKKQDSGSAAGGRLRWAWQPTEVVKMDWTASYEYSDERACPYFHLGSYDEEGNFVASEKETLEQNRPSKYRRQMFNTGLGVEHRLPRFVLTSITAYQYLDDRLFMDQDFTAQDIFSLEQKQRMHTVSEEIALRSKNAAARWQWTTGLFAMYQHQRTLCPVTFYDDGMSFLNRQLAAVLPQNMGMSLTLTDNLLPLTSHFSTPSVNAALFHQSTVRLVGGLSLTLGLRLDYDYHKLTLTSGTATPTDYNFNMSMLSRYYPNGKDLEADPTLTGKLSHDRLQVLPKGALNYALPSSLGNVYFSVSKGYRSGGYNIQSYSELSQTALRRAIMLGVRDFSIETINQMPLPQTSKEKAVAGIAAMLDPNIPATPNVSSLYYKPEYTWSYELGTHLNLLGRALQIEAAVFYMKTHDQQLARFASSGLGREMVNAGRSRSLGAEISLHSSLLGDRLRLSAGYGYTDAKFTNYNLGASTETGEVTDYTDNRVPYVPQHTFNATADYTQPLRSPILQALTLGADVRGAGSIEWDEANSFSQPFYAVLSAHLTLRFTHQVNLSLWAKNLTSTRYATFSFDNLSQRYAQRGTPRYMGADITWKF